MMVTEMKVFMKQAVIAGILTLLIALPGVARADQMILLQVDGLACPFCAYGVEKKLKDTTGVKRVDIRLNEGMVHVTVGEDAVFDEALARRIITEAGFTLRDFERVEGAER